MASETKNPLSFKISVIGDDGTGKDKFINLFAKKQFLEGRDSELGVTSFKGSLTIETEKGQQECIINLWELKIKKKFDTSYASYLSESQGILLIFDLTNRKSFENLQNWIEKIKEKTQIKASVLLIGNKEKSKEFDISPTEINNFIRTYNLFYIETTLTTKEGVFDCFYSITSLSQGIEINNELFLTKDIVYYPSSNIDEFISSTQSLSSKDLSNLGHKAIFEKIEELEEKIKKSMQIEIPRKILIIEVGLSLLALILFLIQDFYYKGNILNVIRIILVDIMIWTAVGAQIGFIVLIVISYIRRH
ncbi:MAG: ADP-ribosylation factor-like protein [Promethearchaeota archaeon]